MSHDFPSTADSYNLCHPIGKGATANVWHATCIPLQKEVAIKIIDLENYPSNLEEIRREIQLMRLCSNPNLVSYRSSFINEHSLWLVMDYSSGGSVYDIMQHSFPNGITDEVLIATILREALKGIEYLHSTGRIHRDVKAGNLLVHEDGSIKVGDFGVSAWLVDAGMRRESRLTFVGTPCWMAPEVMEQNQGYDYKADIWSLGITALEIAKGQAPLAQYPPMRVLLLTLQNPPPSLEGTSFSKPFQNFVEVCLQKDPAKRPTATKLLEHKFLKIGKKSDYVQQTMLKNLPPLWERVKLDIKLPFDDEDGEDSGPTSWNFAKGGLLDAVNQQIAQADTPNGSPTGTTTAQGTGTSGASSGSVNQVVKGRFTKTVISKVNTGSPSTQSIEGKHEEEEKDNARLSTSAYPLTLVDQLNKCMSAILKENETLKRENENLKKELQAMKSAQHQS